MVFLHSDKVSNWRSTHLYGFPSDYNPEKHGYSWHIFFIVLRTTAKCYFSVLKIILFDRLFIYLKNACFLFFLSIIRLWFAGNKMLGCN